MLLRRTTTIGIVTVLLSISLSARAQNIESLVQQTQANPVSFSSILGDKCGSECATDNCVTDNCGEGCSQGCGTCFNWSENTWLSVGAGIRTSYSSGDPAQGGGEDFKLNNARLYFNGQGHDRIGFEFNTDINGAQWNADTPVNGEMRVLDAILKFKLSDNTHFWMGRMLPPSDRSNLSGPYYLNAWNFPFAQFGYPNIFQGRDDGAALWGEQGGGAFKWQIGAYEGESAGGPGFIANGPSDNLLYAGRVTLNLLDPEPGYYNSSTYYGEKDILAIGAAMMHRNNSNSAVSPGADYTGWNLDALYETKLDNGGVVSLEGAFYDFDDDDVAAPNSALPPSLGSRQGQSFFMLASYMLPQEYCVCNIPGKFQVMGRYQEYDRELATAFVGPGTDDQVDIQLNYIMFGHNARISAIWSRLNQIASGQSVRTGASASDTFTIGAQVQF
ncbi:MAG: OprO/OprP family phosphate-selective porin [Fuerstiella sp.]|nr:OprO/OprP family phosphate-selective porin [Fuerstiella sp.]